MSHWVQGVIMILEHYGLIGLFILSFVEASFFPLPPYLLLIPLTLAEPQLGLVFALVGTIGSVLGGVFGYAIGYRVGWPILVHFMKSVNLNKVETNFSRFGWWAIAVGGLTPIPYKIFAITAGVFRMPVLIFICVSALARSIHFFSGVILLMLYGPKVVKFLNKSLGYHNLFILAGLFLLGIILWHTKLWQQRIGPFLLHLKIIWQRMVAEINKTIEILSRFGWYLITGATLTVFGFWVFLKVAEDLLESELYSFDNMVGQWIVSFRADWLTLISTGITNLGSTLIITLIIMGLSLIGFLYHRFRTDLVIFDICVGGALGLTELLKVTFHRPRPPHPWLAIAGGYSFPSGHSLITLSLYGFLAFLVVRNFYPKNKWALFLGTSLALIPVLVGISRVYLGVHYPSDVLAGWAVAAAWLGTCIAGREILKKNDGRSCFKIP